MGDQVEDAFLTSVMAAGYNLRRRIGELVWTGNPVNNLAGYVEFPGFDRLINTGYQDTFTGIVCPALDSVLVNYGGNVVGAAGSPSIVAYLSHVVRRIWYRMDTGGFARDTARMFVVMHPSIADCVWDAYACEYGINCATGATVRNEALEVAKLRDDMRNNSYVMVDGVKIPVVLDNGIDTSFKYVGDDSGICADMYVITTDLNGKTITWGEYQDFNVTGGKDLAWFKGNFGAAPVAVTDGGRYAIAPVVTGGFCYDVRLLTKPRLIAIMPQMLGRIQNVCCVNVGHYPDVTGSGGLYEVDGGPTTTPPNYLYGWCWPTRMLHGGAGR